MAEKTTFAGLTMLDDGEPLSTDGSAFIQGNIALIDRYLEIGAVTHRHNGAEPIANPVAAPGIEVVASGGTIPANVTMYAGYTLVDASGGETILSPIAASGTLLPSDPPEDAPSAVIDYSGGALRVDLYYYVLSFIDAEGGETPPGPWAQVEREPGFASGQVQLSEMGNIAASAGMPGWALYRAAGGNDFHFIASGGVADNTLTDDGNVCADCTRRPLEDFDNGTNRIHSLILTIPDSTELQAASAFRVYMTAEGDFASPALLGEYPIASAGSALTYRSLVVEDGAPPDVPTTVRGASLIDPDTELLDWHWKRPVATVGDLPTVGTEAGDVRVVNATSVAYVATADGGPWEPLLTDQDIMVAQVAASGSGAVAPASAVMFVGSGGLTAEVADVAGSAVVTLTAPPDELGLTEVTASGSGTVAPADSILFQASGAATVEVEDDGGGLARVVIYAPEGGGGGGHELRLNDAPLAQRAGLNVVGSGLVLGDDAGDDETEMSLDPDLQQIAGVGTDTFGRSLLALADALAGREAFELDLTGVGVVVHGGTAGTARPTGYRVVIWLGTVEPTNWVDDDIWIDTT